MIRPAPVCPDSRLEDLLDDLLSGHEADLITTHVESCGTCRSELERLAGDADLWTETRSVLSDTSLRDACFTTEQSRRVCADSQDHGRILLPFLKPSTDAGFLGRMDGYEVESVVGWGGMGVVLRALDRSLGRPVALKVLHPHLAAHGAARKRFAREARAAAAVNHPAVVPIHSVNADAHPPYLVMSYVPGGSLQDRIDREGPLETAEVLRIGYQIADALAAAHAQGLVHRDVKPGNILLDHGQNRVMLSDFGLAQALDDATLSASGVIAGTPQYMSPEQARGATIDARSDLYSLGGVMFAMATGRPPVRGASTLDVLQRIGKEPPQRVEEINPDIPYWLGELIARLQSPEPADRPSSATEVATMLRDCLAHVRRPHDHALPLGLPVVKPAPQAPSRRWGIAKALAVFLSAAAVLALIVVALVVGWIYAFSYSQIDRSATIASPPAVDTRPTVSPSDPFAPTPAGSFLPADVTAWDDGMDVPLEQLDHWFDNVIGP